MSNIIVSAGEESLRGDLRELVGKTVRDTINALREEEAARWWAPRSTSVPPGANGASAGIWMYRFSRRRRPSRRQPEVMPMAT
ncbi:hypothetical protein [Paratractidigestivibacter sp.]|uniref:hypothetical protein n=1 Tax=Paratractidigestivibacter sp. TaxID=2847316 RepID=UPI002AC8EFDF|nr:hypothetical protein [Paratractidigestivibacter sp.]